MAFCTAFIGWILSALGYLANAEQNASVLTAINLTMNGICGILLIGAAVALIFYGIDKKTYAGMRMEIEKKIEESHEL